MFSGHPFQPNLFYNLMILSKFAPGSTGVPASHIEAADVVLDSSAGICVGECRSTALAAWSL